MPPATTFGISRGSRRGSTPDARAASATPAPPPTAVSQKLSASRRPTTSRRPAPRALRTASSVPRASPRANVRLATFAPATSNTKPTAPMRSQSPRATPPSMLSFRGITPAVTTAFPSSASTSSVTRFMSSWAASTETPGARRASAAAPKELPRTSHGRLSASTPIGT